MPFRGAIIMRGSIFAILAAGLLAGCTLAEWQSIGRKFDPANGDSRLVDAKQRAIISTLRPEYGVGGQPIDRRVVCAEPSPDALQATAAALSASGAADTGNIGAALQAAGGTSEGAASFGLRTQSIQLLRDAYFRLCEGYANGAMDDIAFNILQQRYQNHTVALLAVEQLTGAVIGANAAVGAQANSQGSAAAPGVQVEVSQNDQSGGTDNQDGTVNVDGSTNTSASATVTPGTDNQDGPLPEHVSRAVAAITQDALNQDYSLQLCLEFSRGIFTKATDVQTALEPISGVPPLEAPQLRLANAISNLPSGRMALEYCTNRLRQDWQRQESINALVAAKARIVQSVADGIRARGAQHISDKHVFEIISAIDAALPSDPSTRFSLPPALPKSEPKITCGDGTTLDPTTNKCVVK